MKKKDEEAFLKSIYGTLPIKKKDRVEKKLPENISKNINKNYLYKEKKQDDDKEDDKKIQQTKSLFSLEKTHINKKLKKGKIPIERRIDFHGLSVLQAESLFTNTILSCYDSGHRCILFITGKGIMRKNETRREESKLYYGKIRESFFLWIAKENLQKYILSVEQAGIDHGADGAFFVYLRKKN